jgi:DNA-binding transcriptional ArsR family regulator
LLQGLSSADREDVDVLKGTTLKVYRYLFKLGKPAGVRDIQRALGLSSSSVAEYHVKKLLQSGLIKESQEGYTVDRNVWQNMVRMRRTVIPFQAFFVVLFAGAVVVMLTVLRANSAEGYLFGLAVVLVSLGLSLYETFRSIRQST